MSADAMLEPLGDVAYVHDGTTEGLLSAIFQAYALHEQPEDFSSEAGLQPRLGQSVRYIETDAALASRVKAGIVRKAGPVSYTHLDVYKRQNQRRVIAD